MADIDGTALGLPVTMSGTAAAPTRSDAQLRRLSGYGGERDVQVGDLLNAVGEGASAIHWALAAIGPRV